MLKISNQGLASGAQVLSIIFVVNNILRWGVLSYSIDGCNIEPGVAIFFANTIYRFLYREL